MVGEAVLFAVLGAIGTSLAVGRHARRARERHRVRGAIRRAPQLRPEHPDGSVVCVTGMVSALEPDLIAPLSGSPCVLYRSTATSSAWTSKGGQARFESFAMCTFTVDLGTAGSVRVVGEHATLDIPGRPPPADPHRKLRFLAIHGRTGMRDLAGRPMSSGHHRFEELRVSAGDRVSVVGTLMRDVSDAPSTTEVGYRDAHLETRILGNRSRPLVIRVHAD